MHLNHPETAPLPAQVERQFSMKLVPGAKKVRDHGSRARFFNVGTPQNPGPDALLGRELFCA